MKKIFLFAAAVMTAATMSAETVYQWGAGISADQVGTQTYAGSTVDGSVKIHKNKDGVNCINLKNSYLSDKVATNYIELNANEGSFLANDVVIVRYCYNNKDSKVATVAVWDPVSLEELGLSGNGKNVQLEDGEPTEYTYTLKSDMEKIHIARGSNGKTTVCITGLQVVRGEVVVEKPIAPSFSVASGKYFEPFNVGISSNTKDIFFSLNGGEFQAYTDSIEVKEYDKTTTIAAYAELNDMRSDTTTVEYLLKEFVPRTVFNARQTVSLAGIEESDIQILDQSVAEISSVTAGDVTIPAISYKTKKAADGKEDSTMCISFASKPGIKFIYKNKDNKDNILRFYPEYLETEGSNFEIQVDSLSGLVKPGDTIVFVVTAKGSTLPYFSNTYSSSANILPYEPEDESDFANYTTGDVETNEYARIDNDYSGWTNLVYIVKPTKKSIKIKETKGGYRLAMIQFGAYRGEEPDWHQDIENVNYQVKAVKRVVDGQVVIMKGDRMFNVLGAEIKK